MHGLFNNKNQSAKIHDEKFLRVQYWVCWKIGKNQPKLTKIGKNQPKLTKISKNWPKSTKIDKNQPKSTKINFFNEQ